MGRRPTALDDAIETALEEVNKLRNKVESDLTKKLCIYGHTYLLTEEGKRLRNLRTALTGYSLFLKLWKGIDLHRLRSDLREKYLESPDTKILIHELSEIIPYSDAKDKVERLIKKAIDNTLNILEDEYSEILGNLHIEYDTVLKYVRRVTNHLRTIRRLYLQTSFDSSKWKDIEYLYKKKDQSKISKLMKIHSKIQDVIDKFEKEIGYYIEYVTGVLEDNTLPHKLRIQYIDRLYERI